MGLLSRLWHKSPLLTALPAPPVERAAVTAPPAVYPEGIQVLHSPGAATPDAVLGLPFVRGFVIDEPWPEPSPGNYDFTAVAAKIARAKRYGASYQLSLLSMQHAPAWLAEISAIPWHPQLVKHYANLFQAVDKVCGTDPDFKGIYLPTWPIFDGNLQLPNGTSTELLNSIGDTLTAAFRYFAGKSIIQVVTKDLGRAGLLTLLYEHKDPRWVFECDMQWEWPVADLAELGFNGQPVGFSISPKFVMEGMLERALQAKPGLRYLVISPEDALKNSELLTRYGLKI